MAGRHINMLALLTVAAVGLGACGDTGGADETETPETGATQQQPQTAPQQQAALPTPEGATQEQVQQGRQLFTGQGGCQACHNAQATGTQLAPNLTDDEWLNVSGPDMAEIADLIRTGVPQPVEHPAPMPPMGGASLTDDQVQSLAAYVAAIGQG